MNFKSKVHWAYFEVNYFNRKVYCKKNYKILRSDMKYSIFLGSSPYDFIFKPEVWIDILVLIRTRNEKWNLDGSPVSRINNSVNINKLNNVFLSFFFVSVFNRRIGEPSHRRTVTILLSHYLIYVKVHYKYITHTNNVNFVGFFFATTYFWP